MLVHLVRLPCAHQVGGYSFCLVHRLVHRLVRRLVQLWLMYFASAGTLCKGLVCLGFALCRPCATQKSALGFFGVSVPPKPQQAHGDDGDDGDDDVSRSNFNMESKITKILNKILDMPCARPCASPCLHKLKSEWPHKARTSPCTRQKYWSVALCTLCRLGSPKPCAPWFFEFWPCASPCAPCAPFF